MMSKDTLNGMMMELIKKGFAVNLFGNVEGGYHADLSLISDRARSAWGKHPSEPVKALASAVRVYIEQNGKI